MKVPAKIKKEIEAAIKLKSQAKFLEREAKTLTQSAKDTLLPIMTAYELDVVSLAGVGEVSLLTNKGSSINATKLREALLIHGCTSEEVGHIIDSSSKSWTTEYIGFKREA